MNSHPHFWELLRKLDACFQGGWRMVIIYMSLDMCHWRGSQQKDEKNREASSISIELALRSSLWGLGLHAFALAFAAASSLGDAL